MGIPGIGPFDRGPEASSSRAGLRHPRRATPLATLSWKPSGNVPGCSGRKANANRVTSMDKPIAPLRKCGRMDPALRLLVRSAAQERTSSVFCPWGWARMRVDCQRAQGSLQPRFSEWFRTAVSGPLDRHSGTARQQSGRAIRQLMPAPSRDMDAGGERGRTLPLLACGRALASGRRCAMSG